MVFFNHATRQMTVKIVYYGPGLCGKTTNLNTIYGKTSQKARGEMVSLNTETDRTLFFDLLPLDVGMVGETPFFVTCSMAWDAAVAKSFRVVLTLKEPRPMTRTSVSSPFR